MDIDTPRRIKAARALAGLRSADELGHAINSPGLGGKTIRKIEAGERPVSAMELREIARACGLPDAFFRADFEILGTLESLWPSTEDLRALDLDRDADPAAILALAFGMLKGETSRAEIIDLVAGREGRPAIVAEVTGASRAQAEALQQVVAPMVQQAVEAIEGTFRERLRSLEEEVSSLRQQTGREQAEQEIEAAARRREQRPGSSGSATRGPRRRAQGR